MSIVYAELWLDSQRIEVSSELQQTLTAALDYVTTNIYHVEKDGSLLFSGGLFSNGEVLTATFSSVCTSRALGVVKVLGFHFVVAKRIGSKENKISCT